MIAIDSQ